MSADHAPAVLVERLGRTLVMTINRPEAKNAINAAVSHALADAMDRLDDDPGLSVGVVTGAGNTFSAGMDLKAFARSENVAIEGRGMGYIERPPKSRSSRRWRATRWRAALNSHWPPT